MTTIVCPCGADHAADQPYAYAFVEESVAAHGSTVTVTVGLDSWQVPRIWIGMHGLKAAEVATLAERYGWRKEK